jgi:hypothetical protein
MIVRKQSGWLCRFSHTNEDIAFVLCEFPKGDDEHPPLAVSWCSGRAQKVNASAAKESRYASLHPAP